MFLSPITRHCDVASDNLVTSFRRSPDTEDRLFVRSTLSLPRSSTVRALSDVLRRSPPVLHCDVSSIQAENDDYVTSSRAVGLDDDVFAAAGGTRPCDYDERNESNGKVVLRMPRTTGFTRLPCATTISTPHGHLFDHVTPTRLVIHQTPTNAAETRSTGGRSIPRRRNQVRRGSKVMTSRESNHYTWLKRRLAVEPLQPWQRDVTAMHSYTVTLYRCRGYHGYGLTVTGGRPCVIGTVEELGPAHIAGLRRGDVIARINGHRVLESNTDGLARIIRHCTSHVTVQVKRNTSATDATRHHHVMLASAVSPSGSCSDSDSSQSDSVLYTAALISRLLE